MFEEIENLQSEIDKLNRLCEDALGHPFESAPEDFSPRHRERLGIFILKLLDGVLERRTFLRLEKWLLSDTSARHYYIDFMTLTTMLHLYYNPDRFKLPKITELAHT